MTVTSEKNSGKADDGDGDDCDRRQWQKHMEHSNYGDNGYSDDKDDELSMTCC